ncbi:MAG: 6,7-dimethyl-8-ribityllumazine synthase [Saprospiraceae bacterium]|nr:6,7-dimethyl-8-ribityllumazine synthase [Saprospiraceae bacterium]
MASSLKNLSKYNPEDIPDSSEINIGIVVSDWNEEITHALYEGCFETLTKHGVKEENIHTVQVPGSFELPSGAKLLASSEKVDAVICLGCVIKGETPHNEYINQAVATGLTTLSVMSGKPFIFGLLTPNTMEQAKDRAGGKHGNKGVEAAVTALRMVHLKKDLQSSPKGIGFSS